MSTFSFLFWCYFCLILKKMDLLPLWVRLCEVLCMYIVFFWMCMFSVICEEKEYWYGKYSCQLNFNYWWEHPVFMCSSPYSIHLAHLHFLSASLATMRNILDFSFSFLFYTSLSPLLTRWCGKTCESLSSTYVNTCGAVVNGIILTICMMPWCERTLAEGNCKSA